MTQLIVHCWCGWKDWAPPDALTKHLAEEHADTLCVPPPCPEQSVPSAG